MRDASPEYYQRLFDTMEILPARQASVDNAVRCAVKNRKRYADSAVDTEVPWPFIAAIHYRECAADFTRQILNGEPWNQRTRLVPEGLGPWVLWEHSTIFELARSRYDLVTDWSVPAILEWFERHNGGGYMRRGVNSPYLWAGSNHGIGAGKYIADGKYDPLAVDKQIGCALILSELIRLGEWSPAATKPENTP